MVSTIAKLIGYKKAPAATFMLLHPIKGTKALVAAKGAKAILTTRAGAVLTTMVALPLYFAWRRRAAQHI